MAAHHLYRSDKLGFRCVHVDITISTMTIAASLLLLVCCVRIPSASCMCIMRAFTVVNLYQEIVRDSVSIVYFLYM
jgi:hypothetical protein